MTDNQTMTQTAPYPTLLADLVSRCKYRPNWTVSLEHLDRGQGSEGLTLKILAFVNDSYAPDKARPVWHYFPVPPAAYDERSWQRWLFDQFLLVERHEAAEYFVIGDERPYAPHHGPGNDPYIIFDHGTDEDVRTSFRGDVKPPD